MPACTRVPGMPASIAGLWCSAVKPRVAGPWASATLSRLVWPGAAVASRGAIPAIDPEIAAATTHPCTCNQAGAADLTARQSPPSTPQTGDLAPTARSARCPATAGMGVPAARRRGATGRRIGPRIARVGAFRGKSGVRQLTREARSS